METDYSLCPGTANSFVWNSSRPAEVPANKTGKLTLKSVSFLGKGGADLMPALRFEYNLSREQQKNILIYVATLDPATRRGTVNGGTDAGRGFQEGDLITFSLGDSRQAYAVVLAEPAIGTSTYKVQYLNGILPRTGFSYEAVTTKNPPYNKDAYDIWGLYKSDYLERKNENHARLISRASSKSTDAWSLRRIHSHLGAQINIDYESDDYQKPALYNKNLINVKSIQPLGANRLQFDFYEDVNNLNSFLDNEAKIELQALVRFYFIFLDQPAYFLCDGSRTNSGNYYENLNYRDNKLKIIEVGDNHLIVESAELHAKLLENKGTSSYMAAGLGTGCYRIGGELYDVPLRFAEKPTFVGGSLSFYSDFKNFGGGLRVRSVQLNNNQMGVTHQTIYSYSRGATAFEPFGLGKEILNFDLWKNTSWSMEKQRLTNAEKDYQRALYKNFSLLLAKARELPAPGVIYEYVTVQEKVQQPGQPVLESVPGKAVYQFEVFKENMVQRRVLDNQHYNLISNNVQGIPLEDRNRIKTRRLAMEDYTTRLGNLKRVTRYDKQGNKLTETINHYLHDGLEPNPQAYKAAMVRFNNQGVIQENFADARFVKQDDGKYDLLGVMSRREQYPAIQTGTTTVNYRTGLQEKTENLAFDFYSGAVTKSLTLDGYGNRFMSVSVPAYTKHPAMGLKTVAATNKHMLTQLAASYVYKVFTPDNPLGLMGASVQTWSNQQPVLEAGTQAGVWRKAASFSFIPQGTHAPGVTPMNRFTDFNFGSAANPNWRKNGGITLYDVNSKALEGTDVNGNYAATKLGYNQTRPIATGNLANYHEIAFSGAEDALTQGTFGGGVLDKLPEANPAAVTVVSGTAHTGAKSLQINGGQSGFVYRSSVSEGKLQAGRKYVARVWVRNSTQGTAATLPANARLYYKVNGQTYTSVAPVAEKQADGWYALQLTVSVPDDALGAVEVGCSNTGNIPLYFDDFRFQPQDGGMTAYVYDPFSGELTHILDNNNIYTRYEYDAVGRLVRTYRETFQYGVAKTSETRYNYARK